jgi:hypothetical protein
MKKYLLLMLVQLMVYSGVQAQATNGTRYLKPTNYQKRVTTIVSTISRNYYSLSAESASVISVKGPGNLKVLTRGRFIPSQGDKISYEIDYTIDGGEQVSAKMSDVIRSTKATYLNGTLGVPSDLKTIEIDLERGDHIIEFKLKGNTPPVAAQYAFTPTKEKKKVWVEFSPLQPSEPVDLITKETAVIYYRFSADKPVKVQVNGPTELRVLTRVEFQYQMQGRVNYRVQEKENDKVIRTYLLSSIRSDITEYKNNKELIPGKACEFVIDVPAGKHVYEIIPLDNDKKTLLVRFLLPKTDVKLEN